MASGSIRGDWVVRVLTCLVAHGAWLGLGLAVACGATTAKPHARGESHFLRTCLADDCGEGLECLSGLCTRSCAADSNSCTELSAAATCSNFRGQMAEAPICGVACAASTDCAVAGASLICVGGACEGQPLRPTLDSAPPARPCDVATGLDGQGSSCLLGSINAACLDDASDACEPAGANGCPGRCQETQPLHICSGFGMAGRCPSDLVCVSAFGMGAGDDPQGQCLSADAVKACEQDANACPENFSCQNSGHCMPLDVDCSAQVDCKAAEPACPFGYAASRTHVPANGGLCFGPCVAVQHCVCTTNAQCPAPAACSAGRCVLPLAP